jgi:signal transduction histidine kinase
VAKDVAAQYEVIAPRVRFVGDGPAMVSGSADRLRQVLINLVDNAVRATRDHGEVTVGVVPDHDRVRLTVADTGVGIPKDRLARIFDRFYRVDASRDRALGGTGLGLSITKAIVQAHQGTIEVTSEEGQGATFTIAFPAMRPEPATV